MVMWLPIFFYHGILQRTHKKMTTNFTKELKENDHEFHKGIIEPHRHHCDVSLSKTHLSLLSTLQPRKTHPNITEKLLTGT